MRMKQCRCSADVITNSVCDLRSSVALLRDRLLIILLVGAGRVHAFNLLILKVCKFCISDHIILYFQMDKMFRLQKSHEKPSLEYCNITLKVQ